MEMQLQEIMKLLPHRYPFLLVDRILECQPGSRAVGIKNVSGNEPFFQGHFPGYPVMPGVLIIEAMAQVGGVAVLGAPGMEGKLALLAGVDGARFRRQVVPGDKLHIEVVFTNMRSNMGKGKGIASVEGVTVAQAEVLFAIIDRQGKIND